MCILPQHLVKPLNLFKILLLQNIFNTNFSKNIFIHKLMNMTMVLPFFLQKLATLWILPCHRPSRNKLRRQTSLHRTTSRLNTISSLYPSVTKFSSKDRDHSKSQSFVCDFQTTLLRSQSMFPYFFLVAFEGGSLLRALFLLLAYPLIFLLGENEEVSFKIMVFISFCGLRRRDVEIVSKAVLPKFYLENLNRYSCEVLASTKKRVVVSRMPRVIIEGFLREYLGVEKVVGVEVQVIGGCFYSGFVSCGCSLIERHMALKDVLGDEMADVGLVSYCNPQDNLFIPFCKEPYIVTKDVAGPSSIMPRNKYPKPLIFHDGRLAFFPTPLASLYLFLYFPFGLTLAILRILIGTLLPYKLAIILAPYSGFRLTVHNLPSKTNSDYTKNNGVLYVCNHRTLLDPLMLTTALSRPLAAVTYSLSPISELLAPIRTVRLTRNRTTDAATIQRLLKEGDLVMCPEGTTCREPYLLRFSALFAELADEMEPVAIDTKVSMFYGTTASGFKWLDPVFFLMNPNPEYELKFLGLVSKEFTCAGGLKGMEVANMIQKQLGDALGFECTQLTRKDKYLMLAGNEGIVMGRN